ncbi:hypothetical protein A2858_03020 [Candidatus Daviesbacteria bacterium RIFCSPHIGHO2_01_FULL_36_37]|uniref:6-phosphogluconate dehydrogenase (Decarboxylating) n=2 Tax=Candidatus Daviesiibacteriota TaxID=1752718 RepID=A0A1F5K4Y8_9BACT|nr:MAG: hypothetical protein A2858_03020 [Candidatus Daviesbacteria bacterium RIFCSPHIGHO2_01_FULL_36_37]OGE31267.1 MAG: hypothetical protein A3C99_00995 [Candidatus Daviesbacteria bacterium RIFCSPHIGHO2_02_FULL_37_9]OGE36032.1 MAG: hypothetical protein A3E66_00905 [Candidatus Daviesbacteria bacterium RIFCSPHIGHO2_12_FULL_37_16]
MKIGYIGLGRMGKNMVLRLLEQGIEVVAWNRSPEPIEDIKNQISKSKNTDQKLKIANDLEELVNSLEKPRVIWLMLPAGGVTDQFIGKLLPLLSAGDLLIDGANSFYKDTLRRSSELLKSGIHFMDIGVSGGPAGARSGACLMIGGSSEDFEKIKDLAKAAGAPGAYQHLGAQGSGHLAKMVHNAIEYGMMESLGEGLAILKHSEFKYDFSRLLDLYNHKSVIESRLVGWAKEAFDEDPNLSDISSIIGSGGAGKERIKAEGDWTIELAQKLGVDAPSIEASMKVRSDSSNVEESSPNGFRNKVVSALRGKFGAHAVKKS